MAETGQKYTDARRALLAQGGRGGIGSREGTGEVDSGSSEAPDPIGHFTDQTYNLILLAQDESRMLGRGTVEPEHLLLALARRGNVEQLLAGHGITARLLLA